MADINIYGVLHNATPDNTIARAAQIHDDEQNKNQADINKQLIEDTKEIDTQIYTFNAASQTTVTLSPKSIQNKYYKWDDKVTALNITLDKDTLDETGNMLLEYMFEFTSGATPTALTITPEPNWIGSHEIEANKTYQVSIVNGIGVMVGFDTPAEEVNL